MSDRDRIEDLRAEHYALEEGFCAYDMDCKECPIRGDDVSCHIVELMEEKYDE